MEFPKYNEQSAETKAKRALAALRELLPDGEFEWRGKSWIDMKIEWEQALKSIDLCLLNAGSLSSETLKEVRSFLAEVNASSEYLMQRAPNQQQEQIIQKIVQQRTQRR